MATKVVRTSKLSEEPVSEAVIVDDSDAVASVEPAVVSTEPTVATSRVDTETYTAFKTYQIIYFLFGLLELLLGMRFVLKLLGANPGSGFVDFIYNLSGVFVSPFLGIFPNVAATGSVIEWSTIVAMIVYLIAAWIVARIVEMLTDTTTA